MIRKEGWGEGAEFIIRIKYVRMLIVLLREINMAQVRYVRILVMLV